jgi:hypothetical protein
VDRYVFCALGGVKKSKVNFYPERTAHGKRPCTVTEKHVRSANTLEVRRILAIKIHFATTLCLFENALLSEFWSFILQHDIAIIF